jgi:hypothetical protein
LALSTARRSVLSRNCKVPEILNIGSKGEWELVNIIVLSFSLLFGPTVLHLVTYY